MAAGLRASAKALEHPPEPKVGAPDFDPTDEQEVETGSCFDHRSTANRKGQQQSRQGYNCRVTSRLYRQVSPDR